MVRWKRKRFQSLLNKSSKTRSISYQMVNTCFCFSTGTSRGMNSTGGNHPVTRTWKLRWSPTNTTPKLLAYNDTIHKTFKKPVRETTDDLTAKSLVRFDEMQLKIILGVAGFRALNRTISSEHSLMWASALLTTFLRTSSIRRRRQK